MRLHLTKMVYKCKIIIIRIKLKTLICIVPITTLNTSTIYLCLFIIDHFSYLNYWIFIFLPLRPLLLA